MKTLKKWQLLNKLIKVMAFLIYAVAVLIFVIKM